MPSSCCVVGCRSRGNIPQGIQFFQLPLNRPKVLTQWLIVLDRRDWIPKPSSRICSLHFSSEDYLQRINQSVARLKPEAIPSLFPDLNDVQDGDESLSPNPNDNTTKTDDTSPGIPVDSGDISKNTTPSSAFIDTPRPRRVSKLNVKMKDFILLDDIKKHRMNSPTSELQDIPQPSEKEKAAQELLSILEDSNSLSGNESEKDLNILGNSNIVLNKHHSDINNSTNVVLLSKKGPKEDLSSSTSKLAPMLKTNRPGPKSSKKKLVNDISFKLDESEEIASTSVVQKSPSSQGIIKQSDDASKNISARKKTYQIKEGGRFYYFSYSDLNPVVDLSINNKYKEFISAKLSESEPVAAGDNSKPAIEPEVVTEDKEPPVEQYPENVPLSENIPDVENDVDIVNNTEIFSEDTNDIEVDVQSESGSVEYLPTNRGVKRKRQVKKKNIRKKPMKAKNLRRKRTSVVNEVSTNNNQSGNNKTADQNVSSHQTDEGVEILLSDDESTNQLENKKLTTSTKKSLKRKRFKTVAEIVVRTDTTGQVPSVSIDKIVDLESTETPLSKKPRRTRTRYFPSSALSSNGAVGKSPSEDDHFNKLSSQIVDTIKKMRIIENVQGTHSSKLTVLITTLPPVEVNELLVIKKKNIETNYEQSHELQVAISNYSDTDKSTMGNKENDSFIPVIAACDKGLAANIVNKAVLNSEDISQVPADSDGSSENRDPNVTHGCLNAANATFSVNTPLKVINGHLGNDIISSSIEIAESSTEFKHDHTYNSSGIKIISDLEIVDDQFPKVNKLSEDEINYRNKVHRKVRSLKENVKRKTESIQKLKEKIKFLEKTIREERKTKKHFVKQKSRSVEPDTLYASMVDSDIPDTVDYSNAELPSQYDDNMDDSEEESKGCSSPITYLCEPAIDICEDAVPEE